MLNIVEQSVDGMSIHEEFARGILLSFPGIGSIVEPANKRGEFCPGKCRGKIGFPVFSIFESINDVDDFPVVGNFQCVEDSASGGDDGGLESGGFITQNNLFPSILLDAVAINR